MFIDTYFPVEKVTYFMFLALDPLLSPLQESQSGVCDNPKYREDIFRKRDALFKPDKTPKTTAINFNLALLRNHLGWATLRLMQI